MRQKIYNIIENKEEKNIIGIAYSIIMLLSIIASVIPLMFVQYFPIFQQIEDVTVSFFILDYILRWITADIRLGKKWVSFLIYPFTPWAIVDIISILPITNVLSQGFKAFRMTRFFRIIRLFKLLRHYDKIKLLGRVFEKEKEVLLSVLGIAILYIFMTALIMFNMEPRINPETGTVTFESFFDALYWATITLTTVGYGDLTPVTNIGRIVSMLSSIFGVAIIALPSGVITASYLDELRKLNNNSQDKNEKQI